MTEDEGKHTATETSPAPETALTTGAPKLGGPRRRAPGRPAANSEVSKERILDSALQEFGSRGFDGATTAAIARHSDVTQPLVHYYFGTKEALWRAAMEHLAAKLKRVLSGVEADGAGKAPDDAMRLLLRRMCFFCTANPQFGTALISEAENANHRIEWLSNRLVEPIAIQFEELLERGMADGAFRRVENVHAFFAFLGTAASFVSGAGMTPDMYPMSSSNEAHMTAYADSVAEIFVRGILA